MADFRRNIPWTRQPDGPAKLSNSSPGSFAFLTKSQGGFTTTADTFPATELGASTQTTATKYATRITAAPTKPWSIAVAFTPISYPTVGHAIVGFAEAPNSNTFDRTIKYVTSPSIGFSAYIFDGATKEVAIAGALKTIEVCVITCDGATLTLHRKGFGKATVAVSNFGYTGYASPEFVIGAANDVAGTNNVINVIYDDSSAWLDSKVANYFGNPWQLFAPQARSIPFSVAAGGNVSLALTGQSASMATGTVTAAISRALTGQSASVVTGTVGPAITAALTGQSASMATGTVSLPSDVVRALTGQSASVVTGMVGPAITAALTGQSASMATGTVSLPGDVVRALTGQSASVVTGTVGPAITAALTGQSASAVTGTVTAAISRALTGQSASVATGTVTAAITAALAGQALSVGLGLVSLPGGVTLALTGQAASVAIGSVVGAIAAPLTGQSLELTKSVIQFDAASNSGYQTAQTTYSWAHTCSGGVGRSLVVGVSKASATVFVSSITYDGAALEYVRSESGAGVGAEAYVLAAPSVGTHNIVVTLGGSCDSISGATSYTGILHPYGFSAVNSTVVRNTVAADATIASTTTARGSHVIDIVATDDPAITVGAGQTQRVNVAGAALSLGMSSEGPKAPPGSVAMSWTDVGVGKAWTIISMAIAPSIGGVLTVSSASPTLARTIAIPGEDRTIAII